MNMKKNVLLDLGSVKIQILTYITTLKAIGTFGSILPYVSLFDESAWLQKVLQHYPGCCIK